MPEWLKLDSYIVNILSTAIGAVIAYIAQILWKKHKNSDAWKGKIAKKTVNEVVNESNIQKEISGSAKWLLSDLLASINKDENKSKFSEYLLAIAKRPGNDENIANLYQLIQSIAYKSGVKDSKTIYSVVKQSMETLFKSLGLESDLKFMFQLQKLEKIRSKPDWIPAQLYTYLSIDEIGELELIRETLFKKVETLKYNHCFQHVYAGRDIKWSDILLQTIVSADAHQLLGESDNNFVLTASLYLQYIASTHENFEGWKDYEFLLEESVKNLFQQQGTKIIAQGTKHFDRIDEIVNICKAVWDINAFEAIVIDNPDLALCAAIIRLINLLSPYHRTAQNAPSEINIWYNNFQVDGWGDENEKNHVAQLVLSMLIDLSFSQGMPEQDKEFQAKENIKIYCRHDLPDSTKYLIDAYAEMIQAELRFIEHTLNTVPSESKEKFYRFFEKFRFTKIYSAKDLGKDIVMQLVDPLPMADSGLRILSNVDLATASSSEIVERFAHGIIAICAETQNADRLEWSIEYLKAVAKKLRPQLSLIDYVSRTAYDALKNKKNVAEEIQLFLNSDKESRKEAAINAVKVVQTLLPGACFLFGYGGPLWETVKLLYDSNKDIKFVTSTLRPIGEGGEIKIMAEAKKKYDSENRFILIPDELIFEALTSKNTYIPKICCVLMGCEAFDKSGNIINSSGAALISALAKHANIKVLVITASNKEVSEVETLFPVAHISATKFGRGVRELELHYGESKLPIAELVKSEFNVTIITEKSS